MVQASMSIQRSLSGESALRAVSTGASSLSDGSVSHVSRYTRASRNLSVAVPFPACR